MFRIFFIIVLAQLANSLPLQNVQVLSSGSVDRLNLDPGKPNQLIDSNSNLQKFPLTQSLTTTTTTNMEPLFISLQFIQSTSYTKPSLYFVN